MPDQVKVLVIDDEYDQMDDFWWHFKREGFALDFASTRLEATHKYTHNFYDLIVIDALLGRDFNISDRPGLAAVPSGVEIYREIRHYVHARSVPLVILTNYLPRVKQYKLEEEDPYLRVMGKNLAVSQIAQEIRRLLQEAEELLLKEEQYSQTGWQSQVAAENWPNEYPLFIRGQGKNSRIMVHFVPCQLDDITHPLEHDPGGKWQFEAEFRELLTDKTQVGQVLKMVPRYNPHHQPLGLMYLRETTEICHWYEDVLFETAPRLRREVQTRKSADCGVALTARFLLENLYRDGMTVHDFRHAQNSVTLPIRIKPKMNGEPFLKHLGFTPGDEVELLEASREVYERIMQRAGHKQD